MDLSRSDLEGPRQEPGSSSGAASQPACGLSRFPIRKACVSPSGGFSSGLVNLCDLAQGSGSHSTALAAGGGWPERLPGLRQRGHTAGCAHQEHNPRASKQHMLSSGS